MTWKGLICCKKKQSTNLSNKKKQAAVVSILLYKVTKQMLTKHIEKKLDENCTKILWAILNKSLKQHSTKQQLYGHLPPISKTIQIRWTRHEGHCWRSKNELISDVFLWTPSHIHASVGWPTRNYQQQPCINTGCSLEDLPEAMNDRYEWWERVREIHASSTTGEGWWWCLCIYIYIYAHTHTHTHTEYMHIYIYIYIYIYS